MIVDDGQVAARLAHLDQEMTAAGKLRSPRWRAAFRAVHRHVFVPRYWVDDEPGADPPRWRMVDSATPDNPEWFDGVYSDRSLPTELLGTTRRDGGVHPLVTSSTTMPSLVMAMLEALEVGEGDDPVSVLEVGTATGYNAALLCHRFGDHAVTSVEVSPELAALARIRLAAHGYCPTVVEGDGAAGVASRGPFDRTIATCGFDHIPAAWLEQTRPGGKILLNLIGPFTQYTLLLLTVGDDHGATGRVLEQSGAFMPRRTDPTAPAELRVPISRPPGPAVTSTTTLDPTTLSRDPDWGLYVQLGAPDLVSRLVYVTEPSDDAQGGDGELGTELATRDGLSWAQVHHAPDPAGRHTVVQAGPRALWDEVEQQRREWDDAGQPQPGRWELTVDPTGAVTVLTAARQVV